MAHKNKKDGPMIDKPYEEKTNARFSLGKKMKLPKLSTGESVSVTVRGKVKGFRDEEYGRSFEIEFDDLDVDHGMAGDMKADKKKRTAKLYEDGED